MMQRIRERLPELAVLLLCMVLLGLGISRKEGYHMDELLSFELANAEFNPWIVPSQPEGRLAKFVRLEIRGESIAETAENCVNVLLDVLKNGGGSRLLTYKADVYEEPVWITAKQFQDYITVGEGDGFNYLSVYFNVKDDNHPPIHFMLLHTMSSLFRGRVEPIMGCVINLAAVGVTMVLLMKIGRLLAVWLGQPQNGRYLGLLAALLYGTSTGAMASVLLIRMYCVMTCLCVASFYYHLKKWQEGGFAAQNKGLIAVTVLGFLTQYFFLFYCILLAAVTVILLWWQKRKKEVWVYVRSMLLAAVIGVCCFPFSISHVFSSGRGVEALENLSSGLTGYGSRLAAFGGILLERTFGAGLCVLLLAGMLLPCMGRSHRNKSDRRVAKYCPVLFLLIAPTAGYFLLAARMSPYQVDRYIMAVFPFVMLSGACVLFMAGSFLTKKCGKRQLLSAMCAVAVLLQLIRLWGYDGSYQYRGYAGQERLAEEYGEYPCICVYDGVGYYENLVEFTYYEKTLLVTLQELEERREVESIQQLDGVVVLKKGSVEEKRLCDILQERYGLTLQSRLLSDSVYGDTLYMFTSSS